MRSMLFSGRAFKISRQSPKITSVLTDSARLSIFGFIMVLISNINHLPPHILYGKHSFTFCQVQDYPRGFILLFCLKFSHLKNTIISYSRETSEFRGFVARYCAEWEGRPAGELSAKSNTQAGASEPCKSQTPTGPPGRWRSARACFPENYSETDHIGSKDFRSRTYYINRKLFKTTICGWSRTSRMSRSLMDFRYSYSCLFMMA